MQKMAMVRPLTEGEMINGSTPEDEGVTSEPMENCNSRPSSCASSGSKRCSPVKPSLQYSKDDLMEFSKTPLSKNWPSCLDPAYNNSTGKWDPERWFMNHRSDRLSSLDESRSKRDRLDDNLVSNKRKSSDPKERIKDEKDDIVLSPQRRSFGTGCHVIQQSSLARRPGSPLDRDENFREPSRRIGSGRIMTRDRDQRDWERDREYGYGRSDRDRRDRFDPDDDKDLRRYSSGNRYNQRDRRSRGGTHGRIDEVEPEWFSSGPTSQSETIELVGFEDPQHDGEGRKSAKKKRKQNSRRSSLKLEDGEKIDATAPVDEKNVQKKASSDTKQEEPKSSTDETKEPKEHKDENKSTTAGFEIDELFKMDWIPGLPLNEVPVESSASEIGCSRFSQWFRKDSPVQHGPDSGNNSRRSSLHDELIANVLNSIVEPQIMIPSPQPSDIFFAPISPALSHSPGYSLPQTLPNPSKDIMEMLQSAKGNSAVNGNVPRDSKTVKELEADLKRIVLGNKPKEEKSAFDKLLQHMSDSNSQVAPLSMGPLDKSKAVQEQDLLHDMLSAPQRPSASPVQQHFQMFEEKQPMFKIPSGVPPPSSFNQSSQAAQNDAFAQLIQQKQHEQHMQQMQIQQQLQNQMQQPPPPQQQSHNSNPQSSFTVDMLAKLLNSTSQSSISPVSPSVQSTFNQQSMNRNDSHMLNNVLQAQRQRELLSSLLKQQQFPVHNAPQPNVLQQMQQRRCPSAKDVPVQQTLTLPTLGLSPRQSPLPNEAIGTTMQNQGRIPSPLIFGQQPPALSHAPAPIHPAALVQAISQNSVSPNTLQVQNPVVLQRVPSPQELAVHTQSILQNALIKRKLEEQKENYRKRQEAQRSTSPGPANKNGMSSSPLKGVSPIAFTPTSVMRKLQSEKTEFKEQKGIQQQNGNKFTGMSESSRLSDASQTLAKVTAALSNAGIPTSLDSNFNAQFSHHPQNPSGLNQIPRAVHGQAMNQPRSLFGGMNSVGSTIGMQNQGRPIVKVGMNQPMNTNDLARAGMGNRNVAHNKMMQPPINNQTRPQAMPAMPQQLQMAAAYASLGRPPLNHPNMMRPMTPANNAPASNMNFPLLRNAVQTPIRTQNASLNQLNHLNQIAALQMQRGALDTRQLQALAQTQRLHPAALQQFLINSQNPVAQAQVVSGFPGSRDSKHQHLLPGQPGTNRQSPVNLTKWFGNDVLKQKMPDMPPVPHQKALLVEEVERQQQSVHN